MKSTHGLTSIRSKTISRATKSWQLTPILFVGKEDVFSDVELLLEDTWRNFRYGENSNAGIKLWNEARADIVICGAAVSEDINDGLSVLEGQVKNALVRILLLVGDKWDLAQKKILNRRCAAKGLILLEGTLDSQELAKELSEFLTSALEAGVANKTRSAMELLAANEGFKEALTVDESIEYSERQARSILAARWFFSQFIIDPVSAQSIDVLAGTSLLWFERRERADFSPAIAQAVQDLIRLSERSLSPCMQIFKLAHAISIVECRHMTAEGFSAEVDANISSIQLRRSFKQNVQQFLSVYAEDRRFELKGAS